MTPETDVRRSARERMRPPVEVGGTSCHVNLIFSAVEKSEGCCVILMCDNNEGELP